MNKDHGNQPNRDKQQDEKRPTDGNQNKDRKDSNNPNDRHNQDKQDR